MGVLEGIAAGFLKNLVPNLKDLNPGKQLYRVLDPKVRKAFVDAITNRWAKKADRAQRLTAALSEAEIADLANQAAEEALSVAVAKLGSQIKRLV